MSMPPPAEPLPPPAQSVVYIVDDDRSVRTALERLLISAGVRVRSYSSSRDFLEARCVRDGDCVVADVKMHGATGIELQRQLRASGSRAAFIFVTAHDTEEVREEAKRAGAFAYFRKPVDDQALLDAIEWAIGHPDRS